MIWGEKGWSYKIYFQIYLSDHLVFIWRLKHGLHCICFVPIMYFQKPNWVCYYKYFKTGFNFHINLLKMLLSERSLWSLWRLTLNWGFSHRLSLKLNIKFLKNNNFSFFICAGKVEVETSRKSCALFWEKKLENSFKISATKKENGIISGGQWEWDSLSWTVEKYFKWAGIKWNGAP